MREKRGDLTARALVFRKGDVSVAVVNLGTCKADEVVQLYVSFPGTAVERPRKLLRGFQRVTHELNALLTRSAL